MLYDRQTNDLVILGALNAIRGTYTILGRRFDVVSGTVDFVGTPGINPQLNFLATTQVNQGGSAAGTSQASQFDRMNCRFGAFASTERGNVGNASRPVAMTCWCVSNGTHSLQDTP